MAKTKRIIKYINGTYPENLGELLHNADENDLRILIALLMAADRLGEIPDDLAVTELLDIDAASVEASLKFWRGAGVLGSAKSARGTQKSAEKTQSEKNTAEQKPTDAHKDGAVESEDRISDYNTGELADVLEQRADLAQFVDEAQRAFGKTFNAYDANKVVALVEQFGFEKEAVLTLLVYLRGIGKNTVRYCEKLALSLYDEGYTTADTIIARLAEIEKSKEASSKIKALFGIGTRTLTKTEKELFDRWTNTYGYGIDVITLAYEITVNSIQKPVPKYAGSILERWYTQGLKTASEITEYESAQKAAKEPKDGEVGKSYDLDTFFDAAITRSFDDLD